jgi:hypothetical protein
MVLGGLWEGGEGGLSLATEAWQLTNGMSSLAWGGPRFWDQFTRRVGASPEQSLLSTSVHSCSTKSPLPTIVTTTANLSQIKYYDCRNNHHAQRPYCPDLAASEAHQD